MKIKGLLFGIASGDLNGGPIRMSLRIAESLVEKNAFDRNDIILRFFNWHKGPPFDTEKSFDTGQVYTRVFDYYEKGISIEESAAKVFKETNSGGVNGAHRTPPLSMALFISVDKLVKFSKEQCMITHMHDWSIIASIITNLLCRYLILGETLHDSKINTQKIIYEYLDTEKIADSALIKKRIQSMFFEDKKIEKLNRDGFAPDVLEAALYFVSQSSSFEDALSRSLTFAGKANYCPVLVGAFAGSYYGYSNIPEIYLQHKLLNKPLIERISKASNTLADMWTIEKKE